jgi:hypothetical protein
MKNSALSKIVFAGLILVMAALVFATCAPKEDELSGDTYGGIYGVITDKATGEPVRSAGVQLNPLGTKTVTGSEGQYEFTELKEGAYTLQVTKTGYTDLTNYSITVTGGKTAKGDVQIEKLPPSLRVVNDNKQDIDNIAFGSAAGDITRSFSIFNDGPEKLEWEITESSEWITTVSKLSGTLNAGATQAIVVTIDRELLDGGENTTTMHITSDNGSKELRVTATGVYKTVPVLTADSVSHITSATAALYATIVNAGTPAYTERGFVYATSAAPTLETSIEKVTSPVSAALSYTAGVSGLSLDQRYYVRAYAINSAGTAYSSNEINFTTAGTLPTLRTDAVTNKNIGNGSAILNGAILSVGDPAYTERGFVYSTVNNPTVDDTKKIVSGAGTGTFSANLTDLTEGRVYYIKAYALNEKGVAYGNEVSLDFNGELPTLTTAAVTDKNIGNGSATLNGVILTIGDPAYTERGFVYATVHNPTVDDTKKVATGAGTGTFSAGITGLAEGTVYYIRAYAKNIRGTAYGTEVILDFNGALPTLSTNATTNKNIGTGSVTLNGAILTLGDPTYTERGFVYATVHNPTVDDTKKVATGTGTGAFSANLTGLTIGSVYYVRAYATNMRGTAYGEEVSVDFTAVMPTLSTEAVTGRNIANGIATLNGTILTTGDPAYTERGFVYGLAHSPTVDDTKKTVSGTGTGAFSAGLTGLEEGLIYYIRAYAISVAGTVYGEEVSLDFNAVMPTLSTEAATNRNIANGSATLNGTILTVGDPVYTERGFVYATVHNPTVDDTKKVAVGTGTGAFSANLTGLEEGHIYYIRAYVTSVAGTVYGNEVDLDFNAVMPTLSTEAATNRNIANGTATFNGTILTVGDPAYTERGFVYGTTNNPTIDDNKKVVPGTVTGAFNVNVSGMTEGSIYYVRAYAANSKGIVYGEEVTLDFNAVMPAFNGSPSYSNRNIAEETVTFQATLQTVGDPAYTEKGFVYSTSQNPDITSGTKVVVAGTNTGAFSANVTGIAKGSLYYVRAYATTSKGDVYSGQFTVDFRYTMPSVSIQGQQLGIAIYLKYVISNAGSPVYTTLGICYGTSPNPTREVNLIKAESAVSNGITTTQYMTIANSIEVGNIYYVRAYLISEAGIIYSNEVVVTINSYATLGSLGVQWTNLGAMPYAEAQSGCAASGTGGYSDWRLPTLAELQTIYTNKDNIGSFDGCYYWSSGVPASPSNAHYVVKFCPTSPGSVDWQYNTYNGAYARCVRTLP